MEHLTRRLNLCTTLRDKLITEARQGGFSELIDTHKKEINDALIMQEREHKADMEKLKRAARRKEVELTAIANEYERRMLKAEQRLEHITSGEQLRQAIARADAAETNLANEEKARIDIEEQSRQQMQIAASKASALQEALDAALARAEPAERRVARLRRQLWLRRKQLVKKSPSNTSANVEANTSVLRPDFELQCLMDDATPTGNGICRRPKRREEVVSSAMHPELPRRSLQDSILEAMQILSPLQDLAIWRMHADLCVAQVRNASDPCNTSVALNAYFNLVALWRCVWALSLRYFITCFGSLVRLWDRFSDWFCGFSGGQKKEVVIHDL